MSRRVTLALLSGSWTGPDIARGIIPVGRQSVHYGRDDRPEHVVIDTPARPTREDLEALAGGCDLLIIPTTPDALSLDALTLTVDALKELGTERYRILLTMVPPKPSRDGDEARAMLTEASLPIFA